jgi:hypothetical protein
VEGFRVVGIGVTRALGRMMVKARKEIVKLCFMYVCGLSGSYRYLE